ncbi:antitoxin VbhA family protein [Loktanella sp. DJP18]|uniref:antitoxin VbhA family protein n=1 Tax=Loktanella sp. DJP18 TaxID=3409788 RepID=UPI003BB7B524
MTDAMTPAEDADRTRRETAWARANASVLMEGGFIDDETRAMQLRHIAGEISIADYNAWAATRSYA